VVLATFFLTIFRDLTVGILVGFGISSLLFLHRMAQIAEVRIESDQSDFGPGGERVPYDSALATDPDVIVYRISGAFFFAAAASVTAALERIAEHPKAYVIDVSGVLLLDSSAASALEGFVRKVTRKGLRIYVAGARAPVRRMLLRHGVKQPQVRFMANVSAAVAQAHANIRAASSLAKPEMSVARSE
jgi:SulP family sulfate permease